MRRFHFVGHSPVTVLFCGAVACDIFFVGRSPVAVSFCGAVACDGFVLWDGRL
jgi:hypothetical protein